MRSRIAGDRSSSSRIIPNSSINGQRAEAFNSFAMASDQFGWRTSTSNPLAAWHRRNWSRAAGSMRRTSQVVVLVEDKRQQRFVRRYLYRLGYTRHDIQFEPAPGGEGSGAQWALDRKPEVVPAWPSSFAPADGRLPNLNPPPLRTL